jgi:predicted DNA-binding transcriptional regulator AlpA
LGDRASGWFLAEIEDWLDEKRQARNIQGDD